MGTVRFGPVLEQPRKRRYWIFLRSLEHKRCNSRQLRAPFRRVGALYSARGGGQAHRARSARLFAGAEVKVMAARRAFYCSLQHRSTAKRIVDSGSGSAISILVVAPVLLVTTYVLPAAVERWKASFVSDGARGARAIFAPGVDAIAYVAETAIRVSAMIAANMIGETASRFGEDEPAWWILTVVAIFLGVIHLAVTAFAN